MVKRKRPAGDSGKTASTSRRKGTKTDAASDASRRQTRSMTAAQGATPTSQYTKNVPNSTSTRPIAARAAAPATPANHSTPADQNDTSPDTAATRLLGITELCERIIAYLPPRQILICQRVSRGLRDVILGSSMLQRMLMLREPLPSPKEMWTVKSYYGRDGFPREYFSRIELSEDESPPEKAYLVVRQNPFLFFDPEASYSQGFYVSMIEEGDGEAWGMDEGLCDWAHLRYMAHQKASWHDMQLCNPPTSTALVELHIKVGSLNLEVRSKCATVDNTPLTIGALLQNAVNSPAKNLDITYQVVDRLRKAARMSVPQYKPYPAQGKSLADVIAMEEQKYGEDAALQSPPLIILLGCVSPPEKMRKADN